MLNILFFDIYLIFFFIPIILQMILLDNYISYIVNQVPKQDKHFFLFYV